jgi:hypothetical protein
MRPIQLNECLMTPLLLDPPTSRVVVLDCGNLRHHFSAAPTIAMNFDAVPPAAPSYERPLTTRNLLSVFTYKYTELWKRRREVGHR